MAPSKPPIPVCTSKQSGPSFGRTNSDPTTSPIPIHASQCQIPDYVAHYDVTPGDNLSHIATQQLGDVGLWMQLATLNNLVSPYTIQVGQRLILPDFTRYDVTVNYMHQEMITNAQSQEVKDILDAHVRAQNLNAEARRYYADAADDEWYQFLATSAKIRAAGDLSNAATLSRLEAKGRWFLLVRANGPWDHKPILRSMYVAMSNPKGSYGRMNRAFHFPVRGDLLNEYYYDLWSNMHYGFVGTCAGFDQNTLQNSANLGLPGFGDNDQGDFISTQLGIDLWNRHGLQVTQDQIRQAIINAAGLYITARAQEIAAGIDAGKATNVAIQGNDYK